MMDLFFFLSLTALGGAAGMSAQTSFFFFSIADDRQAFIDLNTRDFIKQNTQTDGKGGKHVFYVPIKVVIT